MAVFRSSLMGLVLVFSMLIAGCGGDISERLHGAWKSEQPAADGKHTVIVMTPETFTMNGEVTNVRYTAIALTVEVVDSATELPMISATKIEKTHAMFRSEKLGGEVKFMKIDEEEAKKLVEERGTQ